MNALLRDKICVVTGCGRGIGRAIVETYVRSGAIVYANARAEGTLQEISKRYPDQIFPVYFDVCDERKIKECIMSIKKKWGKLDILVNNAAIMKDAYIGMIPKQLIEETLQTNVVAPLQFIQYASKLMKSQKSGSIINISSIVGLRGNEGQAVYAASKGAVIAMTKSAAKELAPYGIRVNAIAPGIINTELHSGISKEHMEKMLNNVPMGRMGTVDEVANICLFLASELASYVTGQVVGVDGAQKL